MISIIGNKSKNRMRERENDTRFYIGNLLRNKKTMSLQVIENIH